MTLRTLTLAVLMATAGCSLGGTAPVADDLVTVEGTLTEIDDQTPVDGGVTLSLALDGGGSERLLFGSLFTSPPPSEARIALYTRIQEAEVGSRVRATGTRTEGGIELTDLVVLDP